MEQFFNPVIFVYSKTPESERMKYRERERGKKKTETHSGCISGCQILIMQDVLEKPSEIHGDEMAS